MDNKEQFVKSAISLSTIGVISVISFLIFPISFRFYLLLLAVFWLNICLSYLRVENKIFLQFMLAGTVINMVVYVAMKMMVADWCWNKLQLDRVEILLIVVLFFEWTVVIWYIRKKLKLEQKPEEYLLFQEREYDLKRVKNYLCRVPILGIDAAWGDGKTFLVKRLLDDQNIREQYVSIQIDVLTCQLDEIEILLFGELDKLLKRNRVFSKYSKQLKKMLGSQSLLKLTWDLSVDEHRGTSAAFEGLKEDLKKVSKKILIIYDDLDRVTDRAVVDKIMAISDKLAGDKIHILYLYDSSHMEEERDFLEKYIPYQLKLTPVSFRDVVQGLWKELGMQESELELEDITKLETQSLINWSLNKKTEMDQMGVTISISWGNVRRVRIFLTELKIFLQNERNESGEPFTTEERQLLCKCFMVKNFMYGIYETFEVGISPMENLKFTYHDEQFSLEELVAEVLNNKLSKEEMWQTLMQEGNREKFSVLTMLGYEMLDDPETMLNVDKRREAIANEDESFLEKKNYNEKIDRTIWNVMANGVSEFTDIEAFVMRLCQDVLSLKPEEQQKAWDELRQDTFYEKIWKNNRTIFRMGMDSYLAVFQAMKVVGMRVTAQQWCQWIDFYFRQKEHHIISVEMVEALNYVNINEASIYLQVIRHFEKCAIVGNMNEQVGFMRFIKQYMSAIWYLGYSDSYLLESWRYENRNLTDETEKKRMIDQLDEVKKALAEEKKEDLPDIFCEELDVICQFVTKCQQLLGTEISVEPRRLRVTTKMSSVNLHQEEFERLNQIKERDPEHFCQELDQSYRGSKINPRELRELLN